MPSSSTRILDRAAFAIVLVLLVLVLVDADVLPSSSGRIQPPDGRASNLATGEERRRRDAEATTEVFLDFEGLTSRGVTKAVGNYYNGADGGPAYGIQFSPEAFVLVDLDNKGKGNFAHEPSPNTTLYFYEELNDPIMTVRAGFIELSFQYSGTNETSVTFYADPDGNGTVIANATLRGGGECAAYCGDPKGTYGNWFNFSLQLPAIAQSARFTQGEAVSFPLIDDMRIVVRVPGPPTTSPTTESPTTESPTTAPSTAPTPACDATATYWVYNAFRNEAIRALVNRTATCLVHPYNLEVRPMCPHPVLPVKMALVRIEKDGRRTVVRRRNDSVPPFFVFGGEPATIGDVLPSQQPLPNGKYQLSSSAGGTLKFTQACPCGKGKKGCSRNRRS